VGHDAHLLYTLSAVQILALLDRLDLLDYDKVSPLLFLLPLSSCSSLFLILLLLLFTTSPMQGEKSADALLEEGVVEVVEAAGSARKLASDMGACGSSS